MIFRKCLTPLLLSTVLCVLFKIRTCTATPGVRVQITEKCLDYVSKLALAKMHGLMKYYKFPGLSQGKSTTYQLFNMKLKHVSIPSGKIELIPGDGLKWVVMVAKYSLRASLRITKRIAWFRFRKTLSIDIDMSHIRLELAFEATKATNGGLNIQNIRCNSNIYVRISTGNRLLNLVIKLFRRRVNKIIESRMCMSAVKIITNVAAQKIANFPGAPGIISTEVTMWPKQIVVNVKSSGENKSVTRPVGKKYTFDYRLLSNPVITSKYIQTNHMGAIYYKSDIAVFPFAPSKLPIIREDKNMIYFIISDYVLNSWLYSAGLHNLLSFELKAENVNDTQKQAFFQTTCPDSICIGTFMPNISETFPNSKVEMYFSLNNRSSVHFKPHQIEMNFPGQLQFVVVQANRTKVKYFTADLVIFSGFTSTFSRTTLHLHVNTTRFTLNRISGINVGPYERESIQHVLKLVNLFMTGISHLQFPIVVPKKTLLTNPTVTVVQNAIIIASDLRIIGQ